MELRDAVIYGFPYKLRPKPKIAIKAGGSIVSFYIISLGTGQWVLSSAKRMTFLRTKSPNEHL